MIDIEVSRKENIGFTYHDFYLDIASRKNLRVMVEVGVWKGHSISFLAKHSKWRRPLIIAVDLFERSIFPDHQHDVSRIKEMYNLNLNEAGVRNDIIDVCSRSDKAADIFSDRSVDFVFIDASHDHDSVVRDIGAWLPKIRRGGILSGHDYSFVGVNSAVKSFFGNTARHLKGDVWLIDPLSA